MTHLAGGIPSPPSPATFPWTANMWTASEKLRCVQRELKYRISVYARLVAEKKLTERQAAREISIMAAIAEDYKDQVERYEAQLDIKSPPAADK